MTAMTISKGNHFLHLQHGVGKVEFIGEKSFYGSPAARYVEMYFSRDDLTVTVLEKDLPDIARKLISAEEALQLLEELKAFKGKASTQWKARANANQAALDSGDPSQYIKVAKSLSALDAEGSLRQSDREHYSRSLGLLTEELACALGKTRPQTRKLIDKAIGQA